MRYNSLKDILNRFNSIIRDLYENTDEDVQKEVNSFNPDFNLIKQWKEELESEKQSIYVTGKTSTGKSEFHNFLLDENNKDRLLFKASTRVETGIIQTLQHIENVSDSFVKIRIKEKNNFKLLENIPKNFEYEDKNEMVGILQLKETNDILYFRDNIIAKPTSENNYNPTEALSGIDVFYPMKIFKNFVFVDTPGLGSHSKVTDNTVREYIKGKSHIFWFLDASTISLGSSISLLEEEKKLIQEKGIMQRIVFIANKFDSLIHDLKEEKGCKIENKELEIIKDDMNKEFNNGFNKIINTAKPKTIVFTSFKYPNKKLGDNTTETELEKLENLFIENFHNRNYENIYSLTNVLHAILKKINENIIDKKNISLNKKLDELEKNKKTIENKINSLNKGKSPFKKSCDKAQAKLKGLGDKTNHIKTREEMREKGKKINHTLDRIFDERFNSTIKAHINIDKLSEETKRNFSEFRNKFNIRFKTKPPNFFQKHVWDWISSDNELKVKKESLNHFIKIKIGIIEKIENSLYGDIKDHINKLKNDMSEISDDIKTLEKQKADYNNYAKNIKNTKKDIENIYSLIQKDIEKDVSEWRSPSNNNDYDNIKAFLRLISLLKEHDSITDSKRGITND